MTVRITFNISIISDTVCPWCYVGARKLDAGIAAYKAAHASSGDTFDVTWHPFFLNPDAPSPGIDKRAYYEQRFGAERTEAMLARLSAEGAKVGIHFDFGGKTGNTRDSHRVISLARRHGGSEMQNRVVKELFGSYFEGKGDITDSGVIADAAARAGLEREEVQRWLSEGEGGREVDAEVERARKGLVTGVPNFVINGKYEIQGAQDPEGFRRVFEKIKEVEAQKN